MPIGTIQKYDATRRSRKGGIIISPAINGVSEWDLDTPLSISSYGEYTISAQKNVEIKIKMWGAGGGNAGSTLGGAGGYSEGVITLNAGSSYKFIVGQAGKPPSGTLLRSSSSGGGGTAFLLVDGSTDIPLLVAGGGGGVSGSRAVKGGAGGGLSGENGLPVGEGGYGGTQTGPGAAGSSSRRTGFPGVGINGGRGAGRDAITPLGGLGYGQGGAGTIDSGDSGSGGGGGGYFGGGGGGGDAGGFPGGGGSGYVNSNYVSNGITETGVQDVPPRKTNSERENSGNPQTDGKIIISLA